jgi:hypothetical protein
MTRWIRTRARAFAPLALAGFLSVGVPPAPVAAQEAPPNPEAPAEGGSGRPLDGYFGTGILAFLALFIIGKSARR